MSKYLETEDGTIERIGLKSWRVIVNSQHVCGLQGYGMELGDRCPACDEGHRLWNRREEASHE